MSTLQFTKEETKSIITLIAIENTAKDLTKQNGHKFNLSDLKDSRKITGQFEGLKFLQEKLRQADLPTGEIS